MARQGTQLLALLMAEDLESQADALERQISDLERQTRLLNMQIAGIAQKAGEVVVPRWTSVSSHHPGVLGSYMPMGYSPPDPPRHGTSLQADPPVGTTDEHAATSSSAMTPVVDTSPMNPNREKPKPKRGVKKFFRERITGVDAPRKEVE